MAGQGRPSAAKRQRERALAERRRQKLAHRIEAKHERQQSQVTSAAAGIDPDIAHIVPGPQPPLPWQMEE
jgi:hypothetical protein